MNLKKKKNTKHNPNKIRILIKKKTIELGHIIKTKEVNILLIPKRPNKKKTQTKIK